MKKETLKREAILRERDSRSPKQREKTKKEIIFGEKEESVEEQCPPRD